MTIIKKFNYVKARAFGLLHQPTVLLLDAEVSFLTTPLTTPSTVSTLPRRRLKFNLSDPSNSFMVMLGCRLNRQSKIETQ
jgi:hypothetical protein